MTNRQRIKIQCPFFYESLSIFRLCFSSFAKMCQALKIGKMMEVENARKEMKKGKEKPVSQVMFKSI